MLLDAGFLSHHSHQCVTVACVMQGKLGELLVSLCYQPAPGLVNVGIVAARSLKAKDLNGRSGTVYVLLDLCCL